MVRLKMISNPLANISALNNTYVCGHGHVHEIMIGYDKHIYIQAKCWPEIIIMHGWSDVTGAK